MPQTTTNLSITSFTRDPNTGDMDCTVIAVTPLFINELLLSPCNGLGAPVGKVNPGTAQVPVLRTIAVDSLNAVFKVPLGTAFTLAVTYDSVTYIVSDVKVVQPILAAVSNLFSLVSGGLASSSPNDQVAFASHVVDAISRPRVV